MPMPAANNEKKLFAFPFTPLNPLLLYPQQKVNARNTKALNEGVSQEVNAFVDEHQSFPFPFYPFCSAPVQTPCRNVL